jgi:hypothetical protein
MNATHPVGQWIFPVLYTISHLNTEVNQHWAWLVLEWETLQGISGSAGSPKGNVIKACIGTLSSL